jgi:transcriptional regulator of heat shock response
MKHLVSERQSRILQAVIKEYIEEIRPVSSETLARKYRLEISPATIRNEFAELTAKGYLEKPHTSAGRKPTNRGYRYYVDTKILSKKYSRTAALEHVKYDIFEFAEMLATYSKLLASVWQEDEEMAFRGLRMIFSQPEFQDADASLRLAQFLDDLPQILAKLFSQNAAAGIFIGDESPFWENDEISLLFRRVRFSNRAWGIACIIGPTRMSYETNLKLLGF